MSASSTGLASENGRPVSNFTLETKLCRSREPTNMFVRHFCLTPRAALDRSKTCTGVWLEGASRYMSCTSGSSNRVSRTP
ncbi:MAG: hypothetical protein A3K67_02715 [Euryarchaeota archaeon RBG_16_62_10]|nr:MAG: hypothetical protein A3K67_02715 [Euryarchaeota archaeon RBG_16_62_10]